MSAAESGAPSRIASGSIRIGAMEGRSNGGADLAGVSMCLTFFIVVFASLLSGNARADECHVASYRLSDGRAIDIAPAAEGSMRWRMENGESGKLTLSG